jgi:hypothetical protein
MSSMTNVVTDPDTRIIVRLTLGKLTVEVGIFLEMSECSYPLLVFCIHKP